MELLLLLVIGLIAGIIAGLLGIGGGIIFTPVLFFLFEEAGIENPVQWSVASGLFCALMTAGSSTIRQYLQNNMFWREGITLGLLGALGITLGKIVLTSKYYNEEEFVIFFSLILFYAAIMMFRKGRDRVNETGAFSELKFPQLFVTGGIGGFVASLAGVGGGGIMVPIMNLIYKQPFRKTVSVSQLGMTILVTSGVIQLALAENSTSGITDFTMGYVDFGAALPLAFGGLFGGFGGAYLNQKINRTYLQWGFSLLALIMASRLLWSVFG